MIRGLASVYNIIMIINENQSPEIALIQQEHFFWTPCTLRTSIIFNQNIDIRNQGVEANEF